MYKCMVMLEECPSGQIHTLLFILLCSDGCIRGVGLHRLTTLISCSIVPSNGIASKVSVCTCNSVISVGVDDLFIKVKLTCMLVHV